MVREEVPGVDGESGVLDERRWPGGEIRPLGVVLEGSPTLDPSRLPAASIPAGTGAHDTAWQADENVTCYTWQTAGSRICPSRTGRLRGPLSIASDNILLSSKNPSSRQRMRRQIAGHRNLLLGAPGRSSRGPRRDPGGSQRDRPTPASRVPPYRAPGSGGAAGAPATGVKGKERHAGGTPIGTRRSTGGPRSPRRGPARRPTSRAVWRSGDAATTRCRESGTGRPAAGGGRPQPKVSQQLFDDRGRPDTRDEPRPRAVRLGRGPLIGFHGGRRRLSLRLPALPPTDGTVIGAS